jgi:hypothetical protein
MLPNEKLPAALYAIHMVLVRARMLAGNGTAPDKLYRILDWAEVLPSLIVRQEEDTTDEFRSILHGLGEEFPEFGGCAEGFDCGLAWPTGQSVHCEP